MPDELLIAFADSLTALWTKKLGIQLEDYTSSEEEGGASPKSNGHHASSNHCRKSGAGAEMLWVCPDSIIRAELITLVDSKTEGPYR
jgi:hypothetical protein